MFEKPIRAIRTCWSSTTSCSTGVWSNKKPVRTSFTWKSSCRSWLGCRSSSPARSIGTTSASASTRPASTATAYSWKQSPSVTARRKKNGIFYHFLKNLVLLKSHFIILILFKGKLYTNQRQSEIIWSYQLFSGFLSYHFANKNL